MLIFTLNFLRRSFITVNLISFLFLITACKDNVDTQEVPPSQTENTDQTSVDAKPPEKKAANIDVSTNQTIKNTSQPADVGQNSADKNLNTSDKLVLDMGFSEAEDDYSINQPEQNFCLGNESANNDDEYTSDFICTKFSNRLASISMKGCLAAKLKKSGCQSVKGFPIVTRSFLPVEGKTPQGRIMIIGGTHADELTSVSTVFKWIEKLNKYHSGLFHWHVAPLMNPDGLFQKGATRTNHNGVDLNRNMPTNDWHTNALLYWETKGDKNPRKYPGEKPSSEPETRWLIDEINEFKPDAIISVHAPYGIVDFDSLLLKSAPKSLGKLHLNLLGTYPGSLGNYAGINRNIPVITVELPHAWVMPSEKEIGRIWEDIVAWLKRNINTIEQTKTNK